MGGKAQGAKVVWDSAAMSRHAFCSWVALHRRLLMDNMVIECEGGQWKQCTI